MKGKVLTELKNNPEKYVSGEALSSSLGVTRTAVWKYIKELKAEGYVIDSASKKGYMLVSSPDRLNSCEIGHGLETEVIAGEIYCFDEIDSTNNYAKKLAQEGCPDGTVVTAEKQTAGRGRLGRDWSSPGERGIWMSVVLRPPIHPEQAQLITLGASVAAAKGIKAATGIETGIKWYQKDRHHKVHIKRAGCSI